MTTLPPLDGLIMELAEIRASSFTAAAELGLTHGAVRRRIQSVDR